MVAEPEYRNYFEELLNEIHALGYKLTDDQNEDNERIVIFEKYQIVATFIRKNDGIDFDIYSKLKSGIYELGELHLITRKMLELKKIGVKYNGREMNTTERLYPKDRRGENTTTSGL